MRKAIKAVRYLLGKGANIDYMDKNGVTALLAAVHWENNAVAEELLKAGADPNLAVSTHGFCTGPLLSATFKNNFEMIAILMAYGADLRNALELNSKGNGFKINEEQQKMLQTAWNVAQLTRIRHFESTKYMDTLLAVCS